MRVFNVRMGGEAYDGRHLPGFFQLRILGLVLVVLSRPVDWPPWMRAHMVGKGWVIRHGRFIVSWG